MARQISKHSTDGHETTGTGVRPQSATGPLLWLVATPIGNLGDMPPRAVEVLRSVDLILAEDTRVTRKLMAAFGLSGRVERCDEAATERAATRALDVLAQGGSVAFTSDAGTPGVSDPGTRLAQAVLAAGFEVRAVPGASAVLAALSVSGLPSERFAFLGFVPVKPGARATFLAAAAALPLTVVLFETGPRLAAGLEAILAAFGDRQACVARELTKVYEEAWRGPVSQLLERARAAAPRGEIVIVIAPPPEPDANAAAGDLDTLLAAALERLSTKEAVAEVTRLTGLPRQTVYSRALDLRAAGRDDPER